MILVKSTNIFLYIYINVIHHLWWWTDWSITYTNILQQTEPAPRALYIYRCYSSSNIIDSSLTPTYHSRWNQQHATYIYISSLLQTEPVPSAFIDRVRRPTCPACLLSLDPAKLPSITHRWLQLSAGPYKVLASHIPPTNSFFNVIFWDATSTNYHWCRWSQSSGRCRLTPYS
jgi:hypothetical protein